MNLSEHLTLEEIEHSYTALRLGIRNKLPEEMLQCWKEMAEEIFEPIRDAIGEPILISSGYRCEKLNLLIGGSIGSQHMGFLGDIFAAALDLWHPEPQERFRIFEIADGLDWLPFWQLIWEKGTEEAPDWIHVSYVQGVNPRRQIIPYRGA